MLKLASSLAAALALATPALAQQSATQQQAQLPAGVPEQMPFDVPYDVTIPVAEAKHLAAMAEAEARKHDWKMAIAVVDTGGNLVYFEKMDGTQTASVAIAQAKARASALFRRTTKALQEAIDSGHPSVMGLVTLVGGGTTEGGYPLVQGGKLVGAIGCSGGTSPQDGVTCKAAADMMK